MVEATLLLQVLYSRMSLFTTLKAGLSRSWIFGCIMIDVPKLAWDLYLGLLCLVLPLTAMNMLFQDSVCLLHEPSCIVAAFSHFFDNSWLY